MLMLAGRMFENINGKTGKSTKNYVFENNDKYFANINGVISKGYDEYIYSLQYFANGKYAYYFKENGKEYANINGVISKGYDEYIYSLQYFENGKYAYRFRENGKEFANINGVTSNGYDNIYYGLRYLENGKYGYEFTDNGKYGFNINGVEYSYAGNSGWISEENNNVTGNYILNGKLYNIINGKKIEIGQYYNEFVFSAESVELSSPAGAFFYSDYGYEYVVIDGKRYGKAPALRAWYDKDKNAFIWNSIEDKELVIYEYKLD